MDCRPPGSSVHGISQARGLEWVVNTSSRGSSWLGDQTRVSCYWQADSLPLSHQGSNFFWPFPILVSWLSFLFPLISNNLVFSDFSHLFPFQWKLKTSFHTSDRPRYCFRSWEFLIFPYENWLWVCFHHYKLMILPLYKAKDIGSLTTLKQPAWNNMKLFSIILSYFYPSCMSCYYIYGCVRE